MSELTYRSATLTEPLELADTELEGDGRTLTVLIAPYGETAELGGGLRERYTRGAFDGVNPDGIALKLETAPGHAGPVIGRAVEITDTEAGLFGTFRVSATRDGDDALTLARDGALGASAGMLLTDVESDREGVLEIRGADLREVTLTGTPAYQTATVLEVRSTEKGQSMPEQEAVAAEATQTQPDVEAMIADAATRAVDAYRAEVAETETPAITEARHRGHAYRSVGEVIVDMNLHARRKSADATERLTALIDARAVAPDGSTLDLDTRAFTEIGNSVGSGVPDNLYLPELLELLREGRPCADLFVSRQLPQEGNTIQTPEVSQGSQVDYQDGEGTTVESQRVDAILTDWKKSTLAGGQGMTIQAVQWGNPSYADIVVSDLLADYTETLDNYTINGDPAVDTPSSGTGFLGILNAGATDVPVTGDHTAAVALVGTAWAAVYTGSRRAPIAAVMNEADWGAFLDQVDTDGRPIITTEAPQNPAGFGNAASVTGTLRGIPVVVDSNVPAGNVILGSFRDAILFEDQQNPAQIALTYPDALVTDVTVYGFNALAIRRPAAFAVLSGIT